MSNLIFHEYRIPIPGVSRKVIHHFSDVHLCPADEQSPLEERNFSDEKTTGWLSLRLDFAKQFGELRSAPVAATTYFEELMQAAAEGDALVVAGDIFDYVNDAALRTYAARFADLALPHVYVRGNHEPASDIADDSAMAQIKRPVQILDLGDVIIAGFDDANRAITAEQLQALRDLLAQPKPLIIAMHIPIQVQENELHRLCDDYFRLNHASAPKENLEFIDLICQNTDKIAAVLTGHLHFLNTFEIAPGLTQYVSSQGILGNINRYIIGE